MTGSAHLRRCLAVIDSFLCLAVFFPLSIFHWRGTWELQDIYFLPGHDSFLDSNWISFALGANLCVIELFVQPALGQCVNQERRWSYILVSRLHLYIHGWAVMCYWRGLWNLMDIYLTDGWVNSLVLLALCQVLSFATSTLRTVVGIPVSIMLDTDPAILTADTVFKVNPENTLRFIADCLFTQFVVVSSNIAMWRGMWNILDHFLFPHDLFLSDVASLVIGAAVIILLFLLQVPTSFLSSKLDNHPCAKIVFEDFFFIIMQWANLMLWRGGWDLCVHYLLPGTLLGPWLCHWVGTIGLMAFQVFNNVGLNGVERDGQYSGGEGLYPTKYLRVYLSHYITGQKKSNKYSALQVEMEDGEEADVSSLSDTDYSDSSTKPLFHKEMTNGHVITDHTEYTDNHMPLRYMDKEHNENGVS